MSEEEYTQALKKTFGDGNITIQWHDSSNNDEAIEKIKADAANPDRRPYSWSPCVGNTCASQARDAYDEAMGGAAGFFSKIGDALTGLFTLNTGGPRINRPVIGHQTESHKTGGSMNYLTYIEKFEPGGSLLAQAL